MEPQRQSHIIKHKTGPDDPELQASLQEALRQVSPEDVIAIADELAERQVRLFSGLEADSARLAHSLADIAAALTHTRTNARTLSNYFGQDHQVLFTELLAGEAPAPVRVAMLVEKLDALDTRLALEFATGLLHNIFPAEHWLWTRWLWDPTTGTGILPLLAGSTHNLLATNIADGYSRVGAVTAMSIKFGEGTGLWTEELISNEKRAAFANSAFLACAYAVYMYGSTSWRLSRDFNELLPSLPNMARRLLGLPKKEEFDG
jgi:HPt (histidine-containing phosphotransfer) domain-containing protein